MGLSLFLPRVGKSEKATRLRMTFGFESARSQASELGINISVKHYIFSTLSSLVVGCGIAYLTNNVLFVVIGAVISFIVPKMVFSMIRYKQRREILLNLPSNLRLLASKFRDCKSLVKSLEMSLPIMNGVTKPIFQEMYNSLALNVSIQVTLEKAKMEVNFGKFDDLCEKITMGNQDGFNSRVVEGIRETIDDITFDIQLLKNMDVENRKKRFNVYVIFGGCLSLPFFFALFENEVAREFGTIITLESIVGKILISTMILVTLVGLYKRDKYLRLNLDDL